MFSNITAFSRLISFDTIQYSLCQSIITAKKPRKQIRSLFITNYFLSIIIYPIYDQQEAKTIIKRTESFHTTGNRPYPTSLRLYQSYLLISMKNGDQEPAKNGGSFFHTIANGEFIFNLTCLRNFIWPREFCIVR